jgi:hypothetical protein
MPAPQGRERSIRQAGGRVTMEERTVSTHAARLPSRPLRVLFAMPYPGYLRYFDSVVRELAERGHHVELWFETLQKQPEGLEAIEAVAGVDVGGKLPKRHGLSARITRNARWTADYVRYLDPRFADAVYLRDRLGKKLTGPSRLLRRVTTIRPRFVEGLVTLGLAFERALPRSSEFDALVADRAPDLVVVSPLLTPASRLTDLVASARAARIPTVAAIASWDNFTTKGLFRILPDRVVVWNDAQVSEGVELHRIPTERMVKTGAYPFDRWFDRKPSRDPEAFRARVGLPVGTSYALFVGSTASISHPDAEIEFVQEWLRELRASEDPVLSELGVLVRPHPYNSAHWPDVDLSEFAGVTLWPRNGANPVNEDDRLDYFDSIFHATAVVGINTSAMIEAAIQRKPVLSIALPAFNDTQMGTLHFRHLLPENGGFLQVATSLGAHLDQLSDTLHSEDRRAHELDRFVASFLRPHGVERACTPIAVELLEETAGRPLEREAHQGRVARGALRVGLFALFGLPELRAASTDILAGGRRRLGRHTRRLRRRARKLLIARAVSALRRAGEGETSDERESSLARRADG